MRAVAQGSHFRTCHIWFEEIETIDALNQIKNSYKDCDCLLIHGNKTGLDSLHPSKQDSLITDLEMTDEQLLALISKTVKNEINRAERENVETVYYEDASVLEEFSSMYHAMYEQKGIKGRELPTKELTGYINSNQLLISCAKIDGKPVVFHSYVFGEGNSRLLHSCSEFRTTNNDQRNAIGRANKYLHWRDFEKLRSLNVAQYDWGGVSSLTDPNGIDRFKLSFGGKPVTYYNMTAPISLKYRLYSKISNLF